MFFSILELHVSLVTSSPALSLVLSLSIEALMSNALRLLSLSPHHWPSTKWKVLGSAANASHSPLYQSGVVQNHCFLGIGVYFWSWITQIHTLAPSRILLYALVLQCLANACYKAQAAWRQWEVPRTFQFEIYILRAAHALGCVDLSAIRWFAEFPY